METLSYSIPGFVAATGVGRSTIYKEIQAGRLQTTKIGTRTVILVDEGRRWLALKAAETAARGEAA